MGQIRNFITVFLDRASNEGDAASRKEARDLLQKIRPGIEFAKPLHGGERHGAQGEPATAKAHETPRRRGTKAGARKT